MKRRPGMYICTGCRWQWLYLGDKQWIGPQWYDNRSGFKTHPWRQQTTAEIKFGYGDCWPRLIPLGSVTHVTPDGVAQTP